MLLLLLLLLCLLGHSAFGQFGQRQGTVVALTDINAGASKEPPWLHACHVGPGNKKVLVLVLSGSKAEGPRFDMSVRSWVPEAHKAGVGVLFTGAADDAVGPMWDGDTPLGYWWARVNKIRGMYAASKTLEFDWLYVVDDDTFVFTDRLLKYVDQEFVRAKESKQSAPAILGQRSKIDECFLFKTCTKGKKLKYPMGGVGILFNRAAVRLLVDHYDECASVKMFDKVYSAAHQPNVPCRVAELWGDAGVPLCMATLPGVEVDQYLLQDDPERDGAHGKVSWPGVHVPKAEKPVFERLCQEAYKRGLLDEGAVATFRAERQQVQDMCRAAGARPWRWHEHGGTSTSDNAVNSRREAPKGHTTGLC